MYYFSLKNGLSLYCGKKKILSDISFWIDPDIKPWEKATVDGKKYLDIIETDENSVTLATANGTAHFTLSLKQEEECFALIADGKYDVLDEKEWGTHLDEFIGFGLDFDIPHTGNYVDAFMHGTFWQKPYIGSKTGDIKPRTQALFLSQGNDKTYFSTTCDKDFKTEIFPCGKCASLIAHSNTVLDTVNSECILVGAVGKDEYALPESAVAFGLDVMVKPGKLRRSKKYPEVLEYLGWCSWDAFHMDVTEQDLLDKAQEFKDKKIPVGWMIIDDMWGDVSAISRSTMYSRELNSWEADPVRFPNGLKGAVTKIKENYGLKVGIWHPISGYWRGCNPDGQLAREHGDLMEYTLTPAGGDGARYMHSFDEKKVEKFYSLQHAFYKDCGIDFTKVDNQGSTEDFTFRKGSIGKCAANLHAAVEYAAAKYYGNALINCMGMPIENFWNRTSNVNRFSGDFQPENRKWFVQHLLQCSYNSLTQGTVYTGDWDMWWSDDDQAKKNAVLRAMSGGPIYMSDELNRSICDVIMPTVFSNGRIIRLKNPALPTRDCMFDDTENSGNVFKIFNRIGDCGVIAAFNLDKDENTVYGSVSPMDVEGLKPGKYAVYNWFTGETEVLEYDGVLDLKLKNYDDFRLFILVPIKCGKAVIGLKEKYMSPATVKKGGRKLFPLDSGTLVVYSETPVGGFYRLTENTYAKKVSIGDEILI